MSKLGKIPKTERIKKTILPGKFHPPRSISSIICPKARASVKLFVLVTLTAMVSESELELELPSQC